jgi:hypothetical protein
MSTNTHQTIAPQTRKPGRLVQATTVALVTAVSANLLIYYLAPAAFNIPLAIPIMGPGSPVAPLPVSMVVAASSVPALAAGGLLALLCRFTPRAVAIFNLIAGAVLVLSFAAPLTLPVPLPVQLTLASMHVTAAAAITLVLNAFAGDK